ncbi:MAG TPA: hypothetical protein VKQ52_21495 [Puia sp.]|nr:hypothetical protein [Puia sp.]
MLKHIPAIAIACFFTLSAQAQDCLHYFFMQKDKTVEMTIYNKKGEPSGRQVYQVSDVASSGGTTTAKLNSEMFDKKGKSIAKSNSSIQCNGGALLIDMKLMLPQQTAEQTGGAETQANAQTSYIEYPSSMKVGDALHDASFAMDIKRGGMTQTVTMQITERKVLAQESVTTPAGTWDCFKISEKSRVSVKTGPIGIPFTVESTEWYAPSFGVVKSESKNGGTAITSIK